MTETIDTANLRALAEAVMAANTTTSYAAVPHIAYRAATDPAVILALLDRLAAAEARNATLTDDAARLDCLEQGGVGSIRLHGATGRESSYLDWGGGLRNKTLRAAIDAARAAASISTNPAGDAHADPR